MREHHWELIVSASRDVLKNLRAYRGAVSEYNRHQSSLDGRFFNQVVQGICGPAAVVRDAFRVDLRSDLPAAFLPNEKVPGILSVFYAEHWSLQTSAIRLWRFYTQYIFPACELDREAILRIENPLPLGEKQDRIAALTNLPLEQLDEFETVIEQLAEAAQVAESQSSKVDPLLPEVNLVMNQVRYVGACHDVTGDGALLLSKLVESYPQPFSASSLFTKPSRVKDSLPDSLKALIVAETGKGYRLQLG